SGALGLAPSGALDDDGRRGSRGRLARCELREAEETLGANDDRGRGEIPGETQPQDEEPLHRPEYTAAAKAVGAFLRRYIDGVEDVPNQDVGCRDLGHGDPGNEDDL